MNLSPETPSDSEGSSLDKVGARGQMSSKTIAIRPSTTENDPTRTPASVHAQHVDKLPHSSIRAPHAKPADRATPFAARESERESDNCFSQTKSHHKIKLKKDKTSQNFCCRVFSTELSDSRLKSHPKPPQSQNIGVRRRTSLK